ncbi:MAG: N-acetylneuraminate synthase family protein [Candidatus Sericytochromatia bacterium]|nr:N-acetylneuraminate synthase family protein [Candidatus Sericytochromatia bacterium]
MTAIVVEGRPIGPGHPVYVIAEIGGNFTTVDQAVALIDAAAASGVDAVKLQTYRAETLSSTRAMFDMENTGVTSQHALFKAYEIDAEAHASIFAYARSLGLTVFSTPSHATDADMLLSLGVPATKVGSDDAVNLPFLAHLARQGLPMLLSTGMCTMAEVADSVSTILGEGLDQLVLLHAVTSYPTHPDHVNLRAMVAMGQAFGLPVGYSDHTLGPVACLGAVALGACVIEKHFTLDKAAEGPDHMLSADPVEMAALVAQVRALERMLGDGVKRPAASERTTRLNNRKSLVVLRDLQAGAVLRADDLGIKRPGTGIAPKDLRQVLGRVLRRELAADDVLTWDHL